MKNATDQNEVDLADLNEEEFQQWLQDKYPGRTVRREGDEIVVSIPVKFYRRNGRQMVLNESDGVANEKREDSEEGDSLIAALAKAFAWQEQLESGEFNSIEELATAHNVDRSYAGRILRLTSLSPKLVEMILSGNVPDTLSLRRLRKGFPDLWHEQEEMFCD